MKILNVAVADQKFLPDTGAYYATILMKTEDGRCSFLATVNLPGESCPDRVSSALVKDALRQINRMPEYRSGQKHLSVDRDILASHQIEELS